jgi:hypothetical protein
LLYPHRRPLPGKLGVALYWLSRNFNYWGVFAIVFLNNMLFLILRVLLGKQVAVPAFKAGTPGLVPLFTEARPGSMILHLCHGEADDQQLAGNTLHFEAKPTVR